MKIAIQGVKASFHDVAAKKFFNKDFDLIECNSFPRLFEALSNNEADFAIMAIENALAGSILPNYALMQKHQFKIIGEVYLKIQMSLLCLSHELIEDIKYVQSHPMALLQCQKFLEQHPQIKLIEHADTAEAAYDIKKNFMQGYAAIASSLAAEVHGLKILNEGIEDNKLNFTRFLILSKKESNESTANKTTLSFETGHTPGSLVKILALFEKYSLNMTKIQSLPVIGKPYQYAFYIDLEWSDSQKLNLCLEEVKKIVIGFCHFGNYPASKRLKF